MNLLELRNFAPGWFSKVTYRFWHDTVTSRRLLSKSCSGTLLLLLSSIAKRFSTVKVIYTKPLPFFKRSRSLLKSGIKKQSSEMWFFFCYTWSLANRLNIRYSIWQYKPVGKAVLRYRDWLQKILMSAEYQMMLSFKNVCTTNFFFILDSVWRMMISIWH